MFECCRCCRCVENEECYLLYEMNYCRACMIAIENDPDYDYIRKNVLGGFVQIET